MVEDGCFLLKWQDGWVVQVYGREVSEGLRVISVHDVSRWTIQAICRLVFGHLVGKARLTCISGGVGGESKGAVCARRGCLCGFRVERALQAEM